MLGDEDQGRKLRLFFLFSFILIFFLVTLKTSETPTVVSSEDSMKEKFDLISDSLKALTAQTEQLLAILETLNSENITSSLVSFPKSAKVLSTQISELKDLLSS